MHPELQAWPGHGPLMELRILLKYPALLTHQHASLELVMTNAPEKTKKPRDRFVPPASRESRHWSDLQVLAPLRFRLVLHT